MRIRNDVRIAQVNHDLKEAVVSEKWFYDAEDNWRMGFGGGPDGIVGRKLAIDTFADFLDRDGEDGFSLVGIYRGGEPAGFFALTHLGDSSKTIDLFMFLAGKARGAGNVAPSALWKLLNGLFQSRDVFRVQSEILTINRPAISFLRSFGFTQEGIKRASYWMGINNFNVALLRMLRPEWKKMSKEE